MLTIPQMIQQAVQLHTSGQFADAETIYLKVLDRAPNESAALHLLGVLRHQQGRHVEGADLVRRAVARSTSARARCPHQSLVDRNAPRLGDVRWRHRRRTARHRAVQPSSRQRMEQPGAGTQDEQALRRSAPLPQSGASASAKVSRSAHERRKHVVRCGPARAVDPLLPGLIAGARVGAGFL